MIARRVAAVTALLGLAATPAWAASFDCAKAATPFEHAICELPELSAADTLLAKAFGTATGGLTKEAVTLMRADQRNWLDFAQRACTDDAQPMTAGKYDETGGSCLATVFSERVDALEQSRMLGGHRFMVKSVYGVLPDPEQAGDPDSYWKLANHQMVLPMLDSDDALAESFNAFIMEQAQGLAPQMVGVMGGDEVGALDGQSDSAVNVDIKDVAGTGRISLTANSYWYGHGGAHGDYAITYLHYLTGEKRGLVAGDLFAGKDWEARLVDAAWAQLQAEHGEWLQVENKEDIAKLVVDPSRWDLSDTYGLVIQFEPYEVSSYAYGAPTITIAWDKLGDIAADSQQAVIFGN